MDYYAEVPPDQTQTRTSIVLEPSEPQFYSANQGRITSLLKVKHTMKYLSLLLILGTAVAQATTFTVNDPFNAVCPPGGGTSCDVVGANSSFDIQRGEFDFGATSATIRLYFNYGLSNTSLMPFNATPSTVLSLGDLFISGAGFNYGLALQSRTGGASGNVTGGILYSINNANGQLTAAQALNGASDINYRPNEIVWIRNDGAGSISNVATGSVSITSGGDGINQTEFVATIVLNYAAGSVVSNNLSTGVPYIHFTSATCGNDILTNTPEPASLGMIGLGLILAGWRARKSLSAK